MNETTRQCPQCKAPLPANAPQGLCPQCLLKAAAPPPGVPGDIIDIGDPAEVAKALPQFDIIALLGQGGMGVVYKARQRALDRVVALKILPPADALSPDFIARFTREAQSLAKLTHPNIVGIYDFGESGGLYYFSMEFVDGVNLRALLAEKTMTAPQALAIVPCVCDALAYAHDEGVVHRDIKPENILIDKKGRVKIADFGLAKLLRRESLDLTLTATGVMLGTVRYMAPEQMEKPETVDHRADIYSLGVVFYEMLTGEVPMGRFAPPSATSGVDARLDEIVLHTLEREPSARYQHVTEVKTDIEGIANLIEKLPPALRAHFGFDYRSHTKLFGLPLLHVAMGMDPATAKQRVARGIIAIGGHACGVFAVGGLARGVVAFGGIAMGVLAMGGVSLGIFSLGGLSLALFFAYGGVAIAPFALGGIALGYIAGGGLPFGAHTAGSRGADALGAQFFRAWHNRVMAWFWILLSIAMVAQGIGIWVAKRAIAADPTPMSKPGVAPQKKPRLLAVWIAVAVTLIATLAVVFWPEPEPIFYTFSGVTPFTKSADGPVLSNAFIKKNGFTPTQVTELNKTVAAAYADYVRLERQHSTVNFDLTRGPQARIVRVRIAPFPEESLALARRFTAELRGILGKDAIPEPQAGKLISIGLFRHAGEYNVTAVLWEDGAGCHFTEELHSAVNPEKRMSRRNDGKTAGETFPDEYQVYWP